MNPLSPHRLTFIFAPITLHCVNGVPHLLPKGVASKCCAIKSPRIRHLPTIVILLHCFTTFQLGVRIRCQHPVLQLLRVVVLSIICGASLHFIILFWLLQLALFWFLHLLLQQSASIVQPLTLCCCHCWAGINVCLPPSTSNFVSTYWQRLCWHGLPQHIVAFNRYFGLFCCCFSWLSTCTWL